MKLRNCWLAGCLAAGLALSPLGLADSHEEALSSLKERWEHIVTEMPSSQRRSALESLSGEASSLAGAHSSEADAWLWKGIVLASHAQERGGMGALGLARDARDALERAIRLDPRGDNGSAYVTLGALYDRVPGRPLGFGNSNTAEQMFRQALEIRPGGIDVNYYYAVFLEDEGRTGEARKHASRAVEGLAREQRERSDESLREEARRFLATLR
ncbi:MULTISPECIES: hypothetical protein [Halomonadaceae]|uniref:hypothetical protein n=1 Tax=Halomonadaceae TaxID=28256 RepID=UPI001598F7D2|nr:MULTISPECIES: hypothetical protein [Halomonas]QJQ95229.1 hypothetical protein HIO72_08065 [Halomonas sp. PA5]